MQLPADLDTPAAVELDVVVPPAGNLWLIGRQLWLGPKLAGRTVTVWADRTSIHLSLGGAVLKTLPSRFTPTDLARLAASTAPARQGLRRPLPPAPRRPPRP